MTRVLEINAGTVPHPLSRYHVEALEATRTRSPTKCLVHVVDIACFDSIRRWFAVYLADAIS